MRFSLHKSNDLFLLIYIYSIVLTILVGLLAANTNYFPVFVWEDNQSVYQGDFLVFIFHDVTQSKFRYSKKIMQ